MNCEIIYLQFTPDDIQYEWMKIHGRYAMRFCVITQFTLAARLTAQASGGRLGEGKI